MSTHKRASKGRIRPGRVILLLCLFGLAATFGRVVLANFRLAQQIHTVEREIAAMEMRNEQLRAEIVRVQSPEYVERVAREELGLVKPGEKLYILSEPLAEGEGIYVEKRDGSVKGRD